MKAQKEISTHEFSLARIENDLATLTGKTSTEIVLPASLLPKGVKEGEPLIVSIATEAAEMKRRNQTAKDILNEILNTS